MPRAAASFLLAGKTNHFPNSSLSVYWGELPVEPPPTQTKENKKEYNDIILKMFSCGLCANMAMQTLESA